MKTTIVEPAQLYVRTCVLTLLAEEPAHGYELAQKLNARELADVDAGGLYRTLRAMATEGLVVSHWRYGDYGPPRRVYSISEQGRQWLPQGAKAARLMNWRLGRLLSHYRRAAGERAESTS